MMHIRNVYVYYGFENQSQQHRPHHLLTITASCFFPLSIAWVAISLYETPEESPNFSCMLAAMTWSGSLLFST